MKKMSNTNFLMLCGSSRSRNILEKALKSPIIFKDNLSDNLVDDFENNILDSRDCPSNKCYGSSEMAVENNCGSHNFENEYLETNEAEFVQGGIPWVLENNILNMTNVEKLDQDVPFLQSENMQEPSLSDNIFPTDTVFVPNQFEMLLDRRSPDESSCHLTEVRTEIKANKFLENKCNESKETEVVGNRTAIETACILEDAISSNNEQDNSISTDVENRIQAIPDPDNENTEVRDATDNLEAENERVGDPDYVVSETNSESSKGEQDNNNAGVSKERNRKRKPEKLEWDREKSKLRRMRGKEYLGYTRTQDNKIFHNKIRPPRSLGPTCTSIKCAKYRNRFCNTISLEVREQLFQKFWELDWDQKKVYISALMKKKGTGRKFVQGDSRRSSTYEYFLRINNEVKQVCKKMFLSTLGVNEWMVSQWCSANTHGMHMPQVTVNATRKLERPQPQRLLVAETQKLFLKTFLEMLPKMPSHYCRKDSKKLYFEADFGSKANIYRVYQKHCEDNNKHPLSTFTFSETLEDMNLAIFSPKKDQCNVCVSYSAGNVNEEEYHKHIELKDRARLEKTEDKKKAESDQQYTFVMDVQAVKLCPLNNANKFYFKTKLKVHNFTIYNLASHQCTNYWWNETEADLVASVFTTIIIHHLETYCTDNKPIVLWSDGCPYQNRNVVLSNALSYFSTKRQIIITQKFLEPGHTQMECDSVHSVIERKLKNHDIALPIDYVNITKSARIKPFPYDAIYLNHTFFKNYDNPNLMRYRSIRPGRVAGDPTVTNIRQLSYELNGKIKFKLDFEDDLKDLPQRFKEVTLDELFQPLYSGRLKIKKIKYDHLQDIKTTLAFEVHHFYDNLPYE